MLERVTQRLIKDKSFKFWPPALS